MKNKGVTILLIITNIILIAIFCNFIRINGSIVKEKEIIKEMSESIQVTDLNNQINALNTEHTEYMNYIQTCKAQLASTITDMGVETSEDADVETMTSNIRSLLEVLNANKKGFEEYSWSKSTTQNFTAPFDCYAVAAIGGSSFSFTSANMSMSISSNGTTIYYSGNMSGSGASVPGCCIGIYKLNKSQTINLKGSVTNGGIKAHVLYTPI